MLDHPLLVETARRLPGLKWEAPSIAPLEKGGSDRRFYRIQTGTTFSLIVVHYGKTRPENELYAPIGEFLRSLGMRVPRIYAHDPHQGLLWMQDLGDRDLWEYRNRPWAEKSRLYRAALREIFILHRQKDPKLPPISLQQPFTRSLYLWEQSYFFENCLGRYFGGDPGKIQELAAIPKLQEIADRLATLPRRLIHRDFQSRNILVSRGKVYLIDFQGMRWGLPGYDIASLLFDPYAALPPGQRSSLKAYYAALWEVAGEPVPEDLTCAFDYLVIQRLMQALGAYGYLGLVRQKPEFLAYIPTAMRMLAELLRKISGLNSLADYLEDCLARCTKPDPKV